MVYESNSVEETMQLGEELGKKARPGEVYTLSGELGAGKTAFAKGFAKGLGIKEPITSPTYTIVQVYYGQRMPFYHFDVYRVGSPEEMFEIGCEEYFYGNGVCLIEWAELVKEILPENIRKIKISKSLLKGVTYRKIVVE